MPSQRSVIFSNEWFADSSVGWHKLIRFWFVLIEKLLPVHEQV